MFLSLTTIKMWRQLSLPCDAEPASLFGRQLLQGQREARAKPTLGQSVKQRSWHSAAH